MRVVPPNAGGSNNTPGQSNQFNQFSCPTAAADSARQGSTLMPSKAVRDEMKSLPKSNKRRVITSDDEDEAPAASHTPKNTSKNAVKNDTPSSVEWVDSRKASSMTQQERERNVQVAIEQRKQHGVNPKLPKPISKAPRAKFADDGSDDGILDHDTPLAAKAALKRALSAKPTQGGAYKSALLQEALADEHDDALAQRRMQRAESINAERAHRAENRTFQGRTFSATSPAHTTGSGAAVSGADHAPSLRDIYAQGHSQLEAIELEDTDEEVVVRRRAARSNKGSQSSSNSAAGGTGTVTSKRTKPSVAVDLQSDDGGAGADSGSEEGGYRSDMDRSELQALADKVLQQCERLSRNLRQSLVQWEGGAEVTTSGADVKSTSSKHFAGSAPASAPAPRDCVDLTSISALTPSRTNTSSSAGGANASGSAENKQILYDEDIARLCPDLRLKGYQLVGVNWLKLLHQNNVNGVLADDMGLGKTIQTIAFLGWLASLQPTHPSGQRKTPRPHLIVVPASTLGNWELELRRFCPALLVVLYHGSQNERAMLRYEIRAGHTTPDILLTTYTIFERESNKSDRSFMNALQFEYLVLDEAHGIKNAQSSRFVNLNYLKTKHRLLLSGTPVQNDIGELLSMLSFLMPQVFGRENKEVLIEALSWSTSSVNGASTAHKQQQGDLSLAQLRSMLAPFVLRRLKRDVLDQLTDKVTVVKRLKMTPFQCQVYDSILLGHAARKNMLKLKQRAEEEADHLLQDKMRSRVSSATLSTATATAAAAGADSTAALTGVTKPAPVKVTDLTQSSSASADCVSPFNKRQRRDWGTPSRSLDRPVISLLSEDVVAAKNNHKQQKRHASDQSSDVESASLTISTTSSTSGRGVAAALPSEIDLAAIAHSSVNSADIDPHSASVLDDATAASAVQELTASEASNLFTALRKAANHPLLLRVRYRDPKVLEKIAIIAHSLGHFGNQCDYQRVRDEIEGMSDFDIHQLCLEYEALHSLQLEASALYDSPKMELLRVLLPQLQREGHRVLVFSQWTRLLDLLEVLLQDISLRYLRLDGSTPVKTRQGYIDQFNTDTSIPVFLLSTKAGGLGINLTAADTVVLHDLDFNPENDRQAEDRCHRIGQTRAVTVYKLFAEETVDEDIFDMGERKSKLSKAVLQDDRHRQQQQQQEVQGEEGEQATGGEVDGKGKRGRGGKSKAAEKDGGGAGGAAADDDEGTSTAAISSILQKALLRRVHQLAVEGK